MLLENNKVIWKIIIDVKDNGVINNSWVNVVWFVGWVKNNIFY